MIQVKQLSKYYDSGQVRTHALEEVSFTIADGEFVVILGPSGAGKSTLLNILGGIDEANSGEVLVDEYTLAQLNEFQLSQYRAEQIGFIFQFYNLIPTLTVYENLALMKDIKKDILDPLQILEKVGLQEHAKKFPSQLSGGEQQRVSIARAVTKNPKVLLCDEPTGALDSETGCLVLQLLQDICKEYHKTTIIVTHNANIALAADKVIVVKNGKIDKIQINEHPLAIKEVEW